MVWLFVIGVVFIVIAIIGIAAILRSLWTLSE